MNALKNVAGLFLAKLIDQPFFGRAVVLAVVAAAHTIAKGNDIVWDCARAIRVRKSNPVIHRGSMKYSQQRTSANGATTVEVIKRKLPIVRREIIGQGKHASAATLHDSFVFGRVASSRDIGSPTLSTTKFQLVVESAGIGFECFSAMRTHCPNSGIALVASAAQVLASPTIGAFSATEMPFLGSFGFLARKFCSALIAGDKDAIVLAAVFSRVISGVAYTGTRAAAIVMSLSDQLARSTREAFAAHFTCKRDAIGFHGVSPYWPYLFEVGKAVRLAFQTVHEAVLSLLYYTTGERALI